MQVSVTGRAQAENVYCQLMRVADSKVWNASSSVWVTRSSNTSGSYVALTWSATALQHEGSINVESVNPGPHSAEFAVLYYRRVGGSPSLASDILLGRTEHIIQSGESVVTAKLVGIEFSGAIDGSDIALQAWLTVGGITVDLATVDADAECEITIKEQTSGTELLSETSSTITADNHFEITATDVIDESNGDKNYFASITITCNGVQTTREVPITTAG